jgi:hypothetical protein
VGYVCFALSFFGICLFCLDGLQSVGIAVLSCPTVLPPYLVGGIVILSSTIIPLSFDDGGDPTQSVPPLPLNLHELPWLAFTGFTVIFPRSSAKRGVLTRSRAGNSHARVKASLKMDVLAPFAVILLQTSLI